MNLALKRPLNYDMYMCVCVYIYIYTHTHIIIYILYIHIHTQKQQDVSQLTVDSVFNIKLYYMFRPMLPSSGTRS